MISSLIREIIDEEALKIDLTEFKLIDDWAWMIKLSKVELDEEVELHVIRRSNSNKGEAQGRALWGQTLMKEELGVKLVEVELLMKRSIFNKEVKLLEVDL